MVTIPTYIKQVSFRAIKEASDDGNTLKFLIQKAGILLSFSEVIELWMGSDQFRRFYRSLIIGSGLSSYVWETPGITRNQLNRDFEFVLIRKPLPSGSPDQVAFAHYFDMNAGDNGVVVFDNLGKDALLVVPSPYQSKADYSDLAAFLKNAPDRQQHALWRMLGTFVKQRLGDHPLWISVAGGGIAWLHVRIDTTPKYYRYDAYRVVD